MIQIDGGKFLWRGVGRGAVEMERENEFLGIKGKDEQEGPKFSPKKATFKNQN